jgi:hypothetical protein
LTGISTVGNDMKTYLIVTAVVAGLIAAAHIARLVLGESHLAKDPWFVGATLVAAGLSAWSVALLRRRRGKDV